MTSSASDVNTNSFDEEATNESTASINDALLIDDMNEATMSSATTTKDTIRQRDRSQTITQNDIRPLSSPCLNDQDTLHDAIQNIDTAECDDPHDSDSDFELDHGPPIYSNRSTVTSISSLLSSDTTYDMLLNRMGAATMKTIDDSTTTFYTSLPTSTTTSPPPAAAVTTDQPEHEIDWEFWSQMISDADQVFKTSKQYLQHIRQGVPESLRGSVWPIFAHTKINKYNNNNSNNINGAVSSVAGDDGAFDDQTYLNLLNKDNIYEKAIARDLDVLFADQNSLFASATTMTTTTGLDQQLWDPLFHLMKAYANYDDHVGYSKGFAVIALPLLLHMPEEEAFGVFVELMNGVYQWKLLYQPPLDGSSRILFLLDKLILEYLPKLYQHLQACGVHTNDYAKSWFTTLFILILPTLDCVYSVYDILLAEGTDILFGCGLALLKANQDHLLALMEPEDLIRYLLSPQMGDYYTNDSKKLILDAMDVKIQKKRLVKLTKEHQQLLSSRSRKKSVPLSVPSFFSSPIMISTTSSAAKLPSTSESPAGAPAPGAVSTPNDKGQLPLARQQNKALMDSVKQRQLQLEQLAKQQGHSTEELMDAKMELARARQCNDDLRQQAFDLKKALDALPAEIEDRLKQHIHSLVGKNIHLVDRNTELETQLASMENMLVEIKAKFAKSENERDELNLRVEELEGLVN